MHLALALTSILTLFLAAWAVNLMREPKKWRLWWLARLDIVDFNSTREQRRSQERQMSILAIPLSLLFFVLSLSCAWWTFDQVRQAKGAPEASRGADSSGIAAP